MEPQITVNGRTLQAGGAGPHTNLLTWLRAQGLTGAKEGCAEGECGACAVMVARAAMPDGAGPQEVDGERTRWTAINACLVPALAFDGQEIITAEGLGSPAAPARGENLHPVQREMADRGGSQCGYCTPGFICAMAAEYYRPGRAERANASARANATGHADAAGHADATGHANATGHADAAGQANAPAPTAAPGQAESTDALGAGDNGFDLHALTGNLCRCTGYRPIRDAAYALGQPAPQDPLALRQQDPAPPQRPTKVELGGTRFIRPANLTEFLDLYAAEPHAALLAGATDLGVDINLRHARPPLVLAVDQVPELRTLHTTAEHIEIGAALTLSELQRALAGRVPLLSELFPQFASPLIRNTATLGGNLATASPIGDAAPVLLALQAHLVLTCSHGERQVALAEYFTGYRQTVREPGEVIRAIRIPLPLAPLSAFHKVAKRRFDDISSVAVAFAMHTDGGTITQVHIGLGGVAATPIRAGATEAALTGRPWTRATAEHAAQIMATEGTPMDDHRASGRYRAAMLHQAVLKFFAQTGESR